MKIEKSSQLQIENAFRGAPANVLVAISHLHKRVAVAGIAILGATLLTACTAVVSPHVSEAEFLTNTQKRPVQIDVYVTDEFRNHRETQQNVMDMKSWDYELGPVATDAFKYALASRFERVNLRLGAPHFPLAEDSAARVYVVQPSFAGFDAHYPYVFKFETYTAKVTFLVALYDSSGKRLLENTFDGEGSMQGSIGYESAGHAANPVAAQEAVKAAVNKAVDAIVTAIPRE